MNNSISFDHFSFRRNVNEDNKKRIELFINFKNKKAALKGQLFLFFLQISKLTVYLSFNHLYIILIFSNMLKKMLKILCSLFVLCYLNLNAQIITGDTSSVNVIYVNLNPDSIISFLSRTTNSKEFDLNSDNKPDITIFYTHGSSPSYSMVSRGITGLNGTQIVNKVTSLFNS